MSREIRQITAESCVNLKTLHHPCMPKLESSQDETWAVLNGGEIEAVCSLWLKNIPVWRDCKTSVLGHFFASNSAVGKELLSFALKRIEALGFHYVIGPMDGSTWHSYRLVTYSEKHPAFFMEYFTPEEWPGIFTSAGFEEIAGYSSAQTITSTYTDHSVAKFIAKKESLGLVIRSFDKNKAQSELTAIHALSLKSFAKNFLYTDIGWPDFLALYEKIIPFIDPDYFLLAEHQGRLVGFIFAIPDFLQKQRGEGMDTLVIKTVAKLPGRVYAGLGSYLVHVIHQRAVEAGYKSIIHALMHDSNISRVISDKSAHTIRRYALYGKKLGM